MPPSRDIRTAARFPRLRPTTFVAAVITTALALTAAGGAVALTHFTLYAPVPGVSDAANAAFGRIGYSEAEGRFVSLRLSKPDLLTAQSRLSTVTGLAALQPGGASLGVEGADAVALSVQYVSTTYFDVLGVPMQLGRPFVEADDVPGDAARVAIISGRLWSAGFSRADDVLGRTIHLNGLPFSIAGVAADGFHGPERLSNADLWLPGAAISMVNRTSVPYGLRAAGAFSEFVVRRRHGVPWDDVSAELGAVGVALAQENPRLERSTLHLLAPVGVPAEASARAHTRAQLTRIGAAAGMLWILAGLGVAWLLGATAARSGTASSPEAVWYSLFTWAAGAILSGAMLWRALADETLAPRLGLPVPPVRVPMDAPAMLAVTIAALAGGMIFGAAAAWVTTQLRARGRTRLLWAGRLWSLTLVATTLALLVASLSLARTREPAPRGFDPRGVRAVQVDPARLGYTPQAAWTHVRSLADSIGGLRGVDAVAIAEQPPLWVGSRARVRAAGDVQSAGTPAFLHGLASTNYFETLDIPLTQGRTFGPEDMLTRRRAAPGVILSESLARRVFAAGDAVGGSIALQTRTPEPTTADVIGVVGDIRRPDGEALPIVYQPADSGSAGRNGFTIVFRATPRPALVGEIRTIARRMDPNLPIGVSSLEAPVTPQEAVRASRVRALGLLAGVAGWLAAVALMAQAALEFRRRTPASTPPAAHRSSS
jgi:putative ABC transport system permease protein